MDRLEIPVSYRVLRDLHLALAAFLAPFVLLYVVSALQMAHPRLGQRVPFTKQTWETTLPGATQLASPEAVLDALRASHDLRGELLESAHAGGTTTLRVARPGRRYTIEVEAATRLAKVSEEISSATFLLNRLHHASGLGNREPAANAWGVAVLLVCVGLVALVASGILMWLERPKERRVGLAIFATSLVLGLALMISIRLA